VKPPDFIIIGAMKCATSTLHEQLARQPGIFMSTPKEPNFFSDDRQYNKGTDWYTSLFEEAGENALCGESSTHYSKLPDYPQTVARLKQWKDSYKFIYVMRHPVDRLVSHYIHQWSEGVITCDINEAIDKFPELVDYSCYARQLQPYFDTFGQDCVLPVFFESVRSDPQSQLLRIGKFLGYDGDMIWQHELDAQNVSSHRERKFRGYSILVKSGFATRLRRLFIPQSFRDWVKARLRMKDRPQLDEANLCRIEEIFDQDLGNLSEWLGTRITCRNFSSLDRQEEILRRHDQRIIDFHKKQVF